MLEVLAYIGCICFLLFLLAALPKMMLKSFEKSCYEAIERRDKALEEQEQLNKALKKILF